MKIATWNVNGIRARAAQFCEWLERDRPDVVCLQELKADATQVPPQCAHADYHVYWHGSSVRAYSGVSLHLRKELFKDVKFTHPSFDHESRIVQAEAGNLVLASAYVPNGGKSYPAKVEFMKQLAGWARQLHADGKEVLLCGDINIARTEADVHPRERKPVIGQLPEERALFEALLAEHLVDVGRQLEPDNLGLFTWWPPWRNMRQRNIGWRLDYVLASPGVAARAANCRVLSDVGTSDHAPVMMTTTE
jgi:exodeoxyribonuclease-3